MLAVRQRSAADRDRERQHPDRRPHDRQVQGSHSHPDEGRQHPHAPRLRLRPPGDSSGHPEERCTALDAQQGEWRVGGIMLPPACLV